MSEDELLKAVQEIRDPSGSWLNLQSLNAIRNFGLN